MEEVSSILRPSGEGWVLVNLTSDIYIQRLADTDLYS